MFNWFTKKDPAEHSNVDYNESMQEGLSVTRDGDDTTIKYGRQFSASASGEFSGRDISKTVHRMQQSASNSAIQEPGFFARLGGAKSPSEMLFNGEAQPQSQQGQLLTREPRRGDVLVDKKGKNHKVAGTFLGVPFTW